MSYPRGGARLCLLQDYSVCAIAAGWLLLYQLAVILSLLGAVFLYTYIKKQAGGIKSRFVQGDAVKMEYLMIAGSTLAVYLFIVICIRLFGKKEMAQLSIVDLVFVLLISNAVQNAMVGPNTSLLGGLCAAGTLFVANFGFKAVLRRFSKLDSALEGEAVMLVYDGNPLVQNMKKAGISMQELEESAREHGVKSVADVDLAVLERDGNISIISNDFQHKTRKKRKYYKVLDD